MCVCSCVCVQSKLWLSSYLQNCLTNFSAIVDTEWFGWVQCCVTTIQKSYLDQGHFITKHTGDNISKPLDCIGLKFGRYLYYMRCKIHIHISIGDVISVQGRQLPYGDANFCRTGISKITQFIRLKLGRYVIEGRCFNCMAMLMTSFPFCNFDGLRFSVWLEHLVFCCECSFDETEFTVRGTFRLNRDSQSTP